MTIARIIPGTDAERLIAVDLDSVTVLDCGEHFFGCNVRPEGIHELAWSLEDYLNGMDESSRVNMLELWGSAIHAALRHGFRNGEAFGRRQARLELHDALGVNAITDALADVAAAMRERPR